MNIMNTNKGYGLASRLLHWVVGLMIIYQLSIGFWMVDLPNNLKGPVYSDHKMYGLIILALVMVRICWRVVNVLPDLPNTPIWQVVAARGLQRFFYLLMILMPVTGWAMSTAAGFLPVFPGLGKVAFPFVGNEQFCIIGHCFERSSMGSVSHELHHLIGFLFVGCLVIHTSIALWHAYLKDGIFSRILLDKTR